MQIIVVGLHRSLYNYSNWYISSQHLIIIYLHKYNNDKLLSIFITGAFIDGRLVIGITKFDANYEDMHEQDHEMIAVTEDSCRDKVQAIMDAIRSENPSKMVDFGRMIVIPLSGIWARNSKELEMSLEYDPADKKEKNLKKATKALKYDPKLHEYLVCGQGEKHKKAIQRMNPKEVVQRLNVASGITKLTEKYETLQLIYFVCNTMYVTHS